MKVKKETLTRDEQLARENNNADQEDIADIRINAGMEADGETKQPPDGYRIMEEIASILEDEEDPPSIIDLEGWKERYEEFHVSKIHEDGKMYLWRTLKRAELKSITQSGAAEKENLYQDAIIRKCLLWPKASVKFISGSDAGVIPTLFKQIMYKSGFVSDQQALSMIKEV
jgi:hypothetical protein